MDLVWRQIRWPDQSFFIVELFSNSGKCTGNTNAITAHDHRLRPSILIQECRIHSFGIFSSQFEYVAYLNPFGKFNTSISVR